jgi:hypothetical protein
VGKEGDAKPKPTKQILEWVDGFCAAKKDELFSYGLVLQRFSFRPDI